MNHSLSVTGLCLLSILTFAACSTSSGTTQSAAVALQGLSSCEAQSDAGVICGTVFAADGTTPVANATIEMVSASSSVSTLRGLTTDFRGLTADADECLTDDVGAFACAVEGCSGTTEFQVTGSLFSTALTFSVTCTEGEVTQVATSDTTATSEQTADVQWLVIPGAYDGIQLLLSDLKGCTLAGDEASPESLRGSDECEEAGLKVLDDSEVETFLASEDLSVYQAIFANCGSTEPASDDISTALQAYVGDGGNMYFSDLTDSWLTALFPDLVTFPSNKNNTNSGTLADASIEDTGLQVFLGSSADSQETLDIEFNLGVWTAIGSVTTGWTTYIEADVSSLASGLTGTRPITVGGPQEDGCVFYTSYHVEAGGEGTDQETALKYLVLNRMNNCD